MNIGKVGRVTKPVKPGNPRRRYVSSRRAEQAAGTRRAILASARSLFSEQVYALTTVGQIADRAVPGEQREYVQRMHAAGTDRTKLDIYADAVTGIQVRMAPIFRALRDAAVSDKDCAAMWNEISDRRARNMRMLAAGLRETGELREDLDDDAVADIVWSMNAAEYWDLLVTRRGWSPERFRDFLADAWVRLLLAEPSTAAARPRRRKGIGQNGIDRKGEE